MDVKRRERDLLLISEVKKNPMLYDSSLEGFRNKTKTLKTWKKIVDRMKEVSSDSNVSVKMVKTRWKSLRQMMYNEVRHNSDENPRKKWLYTDDMAFIIPYLGHPKRRENGLCNTVDPMEEYLVVADVEQRECDETSSISCEEDEIDIFFKDIAETVKKLTPENQLKVKKDIMNIVLDIKLWETQETKDTWEDT